MTRTVRKKNSALMLLGALFAVVGGFFLAAVLQSPVQPEVRNLGLVTDPALSVAEGLADVNVTLYAGNGWQDLGSHALKVTTNSPEGYTVAINSKTSETALTSPTTDDRIEAVSGTVAEPKALVENTWGYATAENGEAPTVGAKWIGLTDAATVFYKATGANLTGEPLNVYFAANVTEYIEGGTYSNTVVYTVAAVSEATIPAPTIDSVTPANGAITGGTEITIVGENYTLNGESITKEVLIGGKACTSVTITANSPLAGKDTITCTIPEGETVGNVDVEVTTWGGTATAADAFKYDNSDIIYVTPSLASVVAGSESGPTFTIYGGGFANEDDPVVNVYIGDGHACEAFTVVNDTQITCAKGPNDGDTTTGARKVYALRQSGAKSISDVNVNYTDEAFPTTSNIVYSCPATKTLARDTRDSELYYVQKMADGKCWMVDNLKYSGEASLAQVPGKALTVNGNRENANGANNDVKRYADPNAQSYCMKDTNMPAETNTRCGLLYNWYAATDGSVAYDLTTTSGYNATRSICPAGFRLPSSLSSELDPTYSTEEDIMLSSEYGHERLSEYSKVADFPVLKTSLHYGTVSEGVTNRTNPEWAEGFQPNGAWSGVFSGFWGTDFGKVGSGGYYWSATTANKAGEYYRALRLGISSSEVFTGDVLESNDQRYWGFAVRCVND